MTQITSRSYQWLILLIVITVLAVLYAVVYRPEAQVQAIGFGTMICLGAFGLLKGGEKLDGIDQKAAVAAQKVEEVRTTAALGVAEVREANLLVAQNVEEVKITAKAAASEVQEVKAVLREFNDKRGSQMDKMQSTNEASHSLINSAYGNLLKTNWLIAEKLAQEVPGNPQYTEIAKAAREAYENHMKNQAVLDAKVAREAAEEIVKVKIVEVPPPADEIPKGGTE